MENNCGIYKITNTNNNRYYIGSSINIKRRWTEHKRNLNNNKHDNIFLQKSWNKHGEQSFKFEVVEYVSDKNNLIIREQFYLDSLKPFNKNIIYNICEIAGNMLGFKHSDESKEKMSKSRLGNTNSLGNTHTDDTRDKMSKSHTGLKIDQTTITKMISKAKKETLNSKKYKSTVSSVLQNEIISKYSTGLYSTRKLSEIYGISKSTIWNIIRC